VPWTCRSAAADLAARRALAVNPGPLTTGDPGRLPAWRSRQALTAGLSASPAYRATESAIILGARGLPSGWIVRTPRVRPAVSAGLAAVLVAACAHRSDQRSVLIKVTAVMAPGCDGRRDRRRPRHPDERPARPQCRFRQPTGRLQRVQTAVRQQLRIRALREPRRPSARLPVQRRLLGRRRQARRKPDAHGRPEVCGPPARLAPRSLTASMPHRCPKGPR